MTFQPLFEEFWKTVKESLDNRTFAKLTLAKTIGDTELKNIYIRPILENEEIKMSVIARYKTEEIESFHSLDDVFILVITYLKNPFLTVLLFTTTSDFTFKINKKNAGTIIEQPPTFKNASDVMLELKQKET